MMYKYQKHVLKYKFPAPGFPIKKYRFIHLYCAVLFLFVHTIIKAQQNAPFVAVLGIAQDGGYPHMGCKDDCCKKAWGKDSLRKNIVSLALADPVSKKWWLFEATPDISRQLHLFSALTGQHYNYLPNGIFITHAHIGHYMGLAQLGREVMNTNKLPVIAMPKMKQFLTENGPWNQLLALKNISILEPDSIGKIALTSTIEATAFTVPHRDEYSETVGFRIKTSAKTYLFIPDIDKWGKWDRSIVDEVTKSDIAFLDATFYDNTELKNRSISEVPHPLITETVSLFSKEPAYIKSKIVFIHFNHTNKILHNPHLQHTLLQQGYQLASEGKMY